MAELNNTSALAAANPPNSKAENPACTLTATNNLNDLSPVNLPNSDPESLPDTPDPKEISRLFLDHSKKLVFGS